MPKKTRYQKAKKLALHLTQQIDELYALPKDSDDYLLRDALVYELILSALMTEKRNSEN